MVLSTVTRFLCLAGIKRNYIYSLERVCLEIAVESK